MKWKSWVTMLSLGVTILATPLTSHASVTETTELPNGTVLVEIYPTPTPDNPRPTKVWRIIDPATGKVIASGEGDPPR